MWSSRCSSRSTSCQPRCSTSTPGTPRPPWRRPSPPTAPASRPRSPPPARGSPPACGSRGSCSSSPSGSTAPPGSDPRCSSACTGPRTRRGRSTGGPARRSMPSSCSPRRLPSTASQPTAPQRARGCPAWRRSTSPGSHPSGLGLACTWPCMSPTCPSSSRSTACLGRCSTSSWSNPRRPGCRPEHCPRRGARAPYKSNSSH
mmetsp:Transcript_98238/g.254053  ORF Transcript_98238/g.254053 Transcript_98238/m.254053 type:complete len:202 (+) Transcript_98238:745-1350(+)